MQIIVQKFGGSSLASISDVQRCAQIVKNHSKAFAVVVVVSAMGLLTDELSDLLSSFTFCAQKRDVVLSCGEQIAAGILSSALLTIGVKACVMLGWQVPILTNSRHSCAKIFGIGIDRILQKLQDGFSVVIPGFQGVCNGKITTLGRGGSDITAVALAKALKSKICQIYTDVDGLFALHPEFAKGQKCIKKIGCSQIQEMSLKEEFLHERAIDMASTQDLDLEVLSSFSHKTTGTKIIKGIEEDFSCAITSTSNLVVASAELNSNLLNILAKYNVETELVLVLDGKIFVAMLQDEYKKIEGLQNTQFIYGLSVINIVGNSKMSSRHNITKVINALSEVDIKFLHTTKIKIAVAVKDQDLKKSITKLHKTFSEHLS